MPKILLCIVQSEIIGKFGVLITQNSILGVNNKKTFLKMKEYVQNQKKAQEQFSDAALLWQKI